MSCDRAYRRCYNTHLEEFFLVELDFAIVQDGVPSWFSRPRIPPRWQAVIGNEMPNLPGRTRGGSSMLQVLFGDMEFFSSEPFLWRDGRGDIACSVRMTICPACLHVPLSHHYSTKNAILFRGWEDFRLPQ